MTNNHPYFVLGADPHDQFFAFRMNDRVWITDKYTAWDAKYIGETWPPLKMLPEDGSAVYLAWTPQVDVDEGGFVSFGLYPELTPGVQIAKSLAAEGVTIKPTGWALRNAGATLALWQTDEWDTWINESLTHEMRWRSHFAFDQADHSEAPVRVLAAGEPVGLIMPTRIGAPPKAPNLRGER